MCFAVHVTHRGAVDGVEPLDANDLPFLRIALPRQFPTGGLFPEVSAYQLDGGVGPKV
jgi:hypothetical protein